jgi:hypothetical protein
MSRPRWPDSLNSLSQIPGTVHFDKGRVVCEITPAGIARATRAAISDTERLAVEMCALKAELHQACAQQWAEFLSALPCMCLQPPAR